MTVGKILNKTGLLWLVAATLILLPALPLSLWLLFHFRTAIGLALALLGLLGPLLGLALCYGLWQPTPNAKRFSGSLAALVLLLIVYILLNTPSGQSAVDAPIQHQFHRATISPRFSPFNIVPEIEQLNLAFTLIPFVDPYIDQEQAGRVSEITLDLYEEMEEDPQFRALESVQGWALADLAGQQFDVGHYYLYVPRNRPDPAKPMPAIVFLHGSGGNFKVYQWVWAALAEARDMVIISPSFGFGNWRQEGGVAAALAALDDAAERVNIDPNQVYLAGLSNGGLGTSLAGLAEPDRFRGLIFLLPVMANEVVDGAAFQTAWRDRPILVITGAQDRRIPYSYVEQRVQVLRAGGVNVTTSIYPEQDHFLFFAERERVLQDIAVWLDEQTPEPQ